MPEILCEPRYAPTFGPLSLIHRDQGRGLCVTVGLFDDHPWARTTFNLTVAHGRVPSPKGESVVLSLIFASSRRHSCQGLAYSRLCRWPGVHRITPVILAISGQVCHSTLLGLQRTSLGDHRGGRYDSSSNHIPLNQTHTAPIEDVSVARLRRPLLAYTRSTPRPPFPVSPFMIPTVSFVRSFGKHTQTPFLPTSIVHAD